MVITDQFPDIEPFVELRTEEAAIHVLQYIKARMKGSRKAQQKVNRKDLCLERADAFRPERKTPHRLEGQLKTRVAEAFDYLRFNLYLAGEPEQENWYYVTGKGMEVDDLKDIDKQALIRLFNEGNLHPEVVGAAYEPFLRKDYEYAVFSSLKRLEEKVRTRCKLDPKWIGTDLMRKIFGAGGALYDPSQQKSETEALSHGYLRIPLVIERLSMIRRKA